MSRTWHLARTRPAVVRRPGLIALVVTAAVALSPLAAAPALAVTHDPPPEFGTDWDDPQTAAPPVKAPDTQHCSVRIVHHAFDDFDPATTIYTPPARCGGAWSKVVLTMDGSVAGRQYDRIGQLDVGGITIFRLSTPEPSADGISWHVEKDVTEYAPLLRRQQTVQMWIGNVVNDTYTGVFDVTVRLDFYRTGQDARPARTADQVLPLDDQTRDGADLVGTLQVPRNTERLVGEVYATGSGGGCEEFWDTSAPASTGYSCPDGLPYREVDVVVDGRVAGIALPYPHIYTGGWSNPYLWAAIPAPRAFDIRPLQFDLTPFVGELTDGRPHDVRLQVAGLPAGQGGWSLLPNFQVWQDAGVDRVRGAVTSYAGGNPAIDSTVHGHDDLQGSVELTADRSLLVTGYVVGSHGRVTTTVDRTLHNASRHTWTDGEAQDVLSARWTDDARSTTTSGDHTRVSSADLTYTKDGEIDFTPHPGIDGAYDITTTLELGDRAREQLSADGRTVSERTLDDTFNGTASWIYGVPREERHATAHTQEHYRLTGDPDWPCFDRTLEAVNGFFVRDDRAC